jgi:UDP-glucose 4-epimerase
LERSVQIEIDPAPDLNYDNPRKGTPPTPTPTAGRRTDCSATSRRPTPSEGVAQFIDWYRATQEWDDPLVRKS